MKEWEVIGKMSWLTSDSRGMKYFQHSLKKTDGLCPVMSSMTLVRRSAPDESPHYSHTMLSKSQKSLTIFHFFFFYEKMKMCIDPTL